MTDKIKNEKDLKTYNLILGILFMSNIVFMISDIFFKVKKEFIISKSISTVYFITLIIITAIICFIYNKVDMSRVLVGDLKCVVAACLIGVSLYSYISSGGCEFSEIIDVYLVLLTAIFFFIDGKNEINSYICEKFKKKNNQDNRRYYKNLFIKRNICMIILYPAIYFIYSVSLIFISDKFIEFAEIILVLVIVIASVLLIFIKYLKKSDKIIKDELL